MINPIEYLATAYGRKEIVHITKVGAPDFLGICWCKLSNGRYGWHRSPWLGMVIYEVLHPAVVIPSENRDAYLVKPHVGEKFEVSLDQVERMQNED